MDYPDKRPDNLCLAPFIMTRPDVRGLNSPCPFGAGDWPHAHLNGEQQWHADELNQLRQTHLNNERAGECNRCFTEEKIGKPSLRQRMLHQYDQYNIDVYEDFIKTEQYLNGPKIIVYRSSNVCNLACRSCGAHDSNQFDPEGQVYAKRYGDGGAFVSKFPATHVPMEEWIPVAKNLERLEFFGGEPLLNITQYEILQYLVDSGRANQVQLLYNSNATNKPTDRLKDLWKEFKSIDISLSIDGIESRFEYLRYPGKWEVLLDVVDDIQNMNLGIPTKLFGNMTMSMQNVLNLKEIMDWQRETFGSEPWIGFAEGPHYMNIRNFPKHIKEQLLEQITRQEVKDYMMLSETDPKGYEHFLVWMKRMDEYRKQSFGDTFTKLYDIIKEDYDSMNHCESIV
jgi:MoaA/NifB/PqqE/SkfB family radical SAM enzyme